MAFDEATGKVLLFGGYPTFYPAGSSLPMARQLGDTWSWDGARWTAEQPTPSPAARTDAAMTYDAARRVVVLHGGQGVTTGFVNDTWTWNGTGWVLMNPDKTPPAMWGEHQPITWDGDHEVVLLFDWTGRWTSPSELNQTWEWDGANWTRLPAPDAPSGHTAVAAAIAYDAARKSTVFFGHVRGTPTTWTFDGTAWAMASSTGSASMNFSLRRTARAQFWSCSARTATPGTGMERSGRLWPQPIRHRRVLAHPWCTTRSTMSSSSLAAPRIR